MGHVQKICLFCLIEIYAKNETYAISGIIVCSSPEPTCMLLAYAAYGYTVNSEIFARVLFSRDFAYAKFRANRTLANWRNHSVFY